MTLRFAAAILKTELDLEQRCEELVDDNLIQDFIDNCGYSKREARIAAYETLEFM